MTKKQLIDSMDARYETGFVYRATGQTDGTCSNVVENIIYSKVRDAALTEDERLTYSYYDDGNIRKTDHKKKDADGNFVTYSTDYVYDALGQLVRVNDQEEGKTRVYTYNAGFNMTSEKVYAYTTAAVPSGNYMERTFVYDSVWKDQLDYIRIDNSENRELVFDGAGNLTNDNGNSFTWKNGRQLAGITKSDGTQIGYSYDHNGMRVKKTVGSNIHTYRYCGSLLMEEKAGSTVMRFSYDSLGNAVAILYNGTEYYYMRNLQGDVIGLMNKNGEWVVRYRYDVWGNILEVSGIRASTLGQDNPFRYRGYFYDAETGLYYLKSRYYSPELCRFISPDTLDILSVSKNLYDKNLYAYCDNNPIIRKDEDGEFWNIIAGAVIGASISAITQVIDNKISGSNVMEGVLLAAMGGGITGGLAATGAGRIAQTVASGIVGAGCDFISQYSSVGLNNIDWRQVVSSGVFGAASGYIGNDGIRHKSGNLAKATKVYDYAVDGIKNQKWSSNKGGKYLTLASKKLQTVWKEELSITTRRFTIGTIVSTTGKRKFVKYIM